MNFVWLSCLLLLAVNSCESADSKYSLYYSNQMPATSYDAGYKKASDYSEKPVPTSAYTGSRSSSYSASSKSLYTKSYQDKVKNLNKVQLEEVIKNLYAKIQMTSNDLDSVLIALKSSKYYTTLTTGPILTSLNQLMDQIMTSTYFNTNGTDALIALYESRNEIEDQKALLDAAKASYNDAVLAMAAAIQQNPANLVFLVNEALAAAKTAAKAIAGAANATAISLEDVETVIEQLADSNVVVNSSAIATAQNFSDEADTQNTLFTTINALANATDATTAAALLTSLTDSNGGYPVRVEAAVQGGLNIISLYLDALKKLPFVSYLDFINGFTPAQLLVLNNQLLIQEKAQETINDAFTIQGLLPSAMKFTYEVIFYAEKIQNDAIEAGQAVIQIAKLEKGVMGSSSYGTGYGYK